MKGKVDIPVLEKVLEKTGVTRVTYEHLFCPDGRSVGIEGTICRLWKGEKLRETGIAKVHPKDQYCRKIGRIVSLGLAIRAMDIKRRRTG